jgi:(+)-trans-carveol dehydrogenase
MTTSRSTRPGRFAGKVVLITGAARGQGRSHALRFAEEGADIIAVDVCEQIEGVPYPMATPDDLAETVRQVEDRDARIVASVADVRDVTAMMAAVEHGLDALGRLDIVCANAGVSGSYLAGDDIAERVASFRRILDVNLTGVMITIEVSRGPMIAGGRGGSIVVTNSVAGLKALGVGGGYGEAKHALIGLVKAAARALAPHGIRVNNIHPTNVNTTLLMNDAVYRAFLPQFEEPTMEDITSALSTVNLIPVPYIEPNDVSDLVLFVSSDEARFITGASLPVDAGALIK